MPTTSNFGWTTPADTDLVKDGAAAIRTLGNGIDTSFVDLKGGTTGQVLAKASNTDLDFSWVAQDDSNAIQNSIIDAKGDLIVGSANDTPVRLAVGGTNGQVLTVNSSATYGVEWAAAAGASGPAFRAYRGTSDQSISQNTWTKIQLNFETYDTDSNFDPTTNYRFTPTKSGYYQFNFGIWMYSPGYTMVGIYKNGSVYSRQQMDAAVTYRGHSLSDVIYANGTTDYFEVYAYAQSSGTRDVTNGQDNTFFSGVWIRS